MPGRWRAKDVENRPGKTWLAAAIAHARTLGQTQRVDLRNSAASVKKAGLGCLLGFNTEPEVTSKLMLVDEPGLSQDGGRSGGVDPAKLAVGLTHVSAVGVVPVLFATPLEHFLLMPHLGPDASKDVRPPPALASAEIARMTARATGWAPVLADRIGQVAPGWLEEPFLLELILHVAEERPALRDDMPALTRAAIDEAKLQHEYLL
jgi:hypothetical protein